MELMTRVLAIVSCVVFVLTAALAHLAGHGGAAACFILLAAAHGFKAVWSEE